MFQIADYITEVVVSEDSKAVGPDNRGPAGTRRSG